MGIPTSDRRSRPQYAGTVTLSAKAVATKAADNGQHSTDPKTWMSLPQTLKARTGVSGLTSGTIQYFRRQAPKGAMATGVRSFRF
jgi:hypothetical protein